MVVRGFTSAICPKGATASRSVMRPEHRVKFKLRPMRPETKDKGLAVRCQIAPLVGKACLSQNVTRSMVGSVS